MSVSSPQAGSAPFHTLPRLLPQDRFRLAGRTSVQHVAHTITQVPPHILGLPVVPFVFTATLLLKGLGQFIQAFHKPTRSMLPD